MIAAMPRAAVTAAVATKKGQAMTLLEPRIEEVYLLAHAEGIKEATPFDMLKVLYFFLLPRTPTPAVVTPPVSACTSWHFSASKGRAGCLDSQ